MAAANMKSVKLRIKSIQNTMQITKAMELVASSKLRRAKERAEASAPYFSALRQTLSNIAAENTDYTSVYARENQSERHCYILIAGDRGMAGGYNANLFRTFEAESKGKDLLSCRSAKRRRTMSRRKNFRASRARSSWSPPFMSRIAMRLRDRFARCFAAVRSDTSRLSTQTLSR